MSRHPVALGGAGGGTGTVTHTAGALTLNAGVFGNGSADLKVDPLFTTDGSGNVTATSFTTTGAGSAFTQWTTSAFAVSSAGTVACGAFTGNIFACSDNGGPVTALPFIAGDIGGTQPSPQITAAHFTGDVSFGTTFGSITVPNAGATGTTVNLLAKLNASGNAVLPAVTDTFLPMLGIVTSGAGTSGSAHVAVMGQASCIADGTVTAGDSIGVGTSTAGRCKSIAAQGVAPAAGLSVIGVAMGSSTVGVAFNVWLTPISMWNPGSSLNAAATVISVPSTAQIQASNGSAATPSISFASATGVGLYESGGNQLNVGVASGAQMSINSSATNVVALNVPIASTLFSVNSSGLPTKSNNVVLAGQGFPLIQGITSQKAETTTADANVLTVTPASAAGSYRLRVVISVSAATSGVIGWTATWTDSNGNAQTPTNLALFQSGTAVPALTFTTSAVSNYYGEAMIDVNNAGTAIVIKWTGGGTTTAKMTATVERII